MLNTKVNTTHIGWDEDMDFERLHGVLNIGGADFHVEALLVEEENSSDVVDPSLINRVEGIQSYDGHSTKYETVEIDGSHYLLIVTPFQT